MRPGGRPAEQIPGGFAARRRPDVAWVELDGEVVVYDAAERTSYLLNATAGLIWRLLDGDDTLEGLADDLAEAFGADAAMVRADVVAAVADLGRQGLLDGVAPAEADHIDAATGGPATGEARPPR